MEKKFVIQAPFVPKGQQPQAISVLIQGLQDGLSHQTLLGVTGSGKTFTIASVIADTQRPALLIAPNKTLAAQLYGELKQFFPHNAVEYFVSYYDYYQPEAYMPATDTFIEKDASINQHIEQMRLSATKAVLERRDTVIVSTVSAIYGLGDPQAYLQMVLHIGCGEHIDQRDMLKRLATMQYTRNDTELKRATFRVRGDVIDIHPAESEHQALRVQLLDDEIEKIRLFDPLTGRIIKDLPRVTIFPKSHYVTPRETLQRMIDKVYAELEQRLAVLRGDNRLVEAQRLEQRTRYDMEMVQELGYCSGIENYSRYLSQRAAGEPPPVLLDYLPQDALLIIDESHVTLPQLRGMYRGDRARKESLVNYGFRLPSAMDNRPLMFEEFSAFALQTIYVSATPGEIERAPGISVIDLVVRPTGLLDPQVIVRPIETQVDDLLSEIKACTQKKERVLVTTLTKKMSEHLAEYYTEHGVKVRYLHSDIDTVERVEILRDLREGVFDVLIGVNLLREGLDLPEVALVAILDADKTGFLRSTASLIQTIGRCARHVEGRAILYADVMTDAIRAAIDETTRRRTVQQQYNKTHGITPQSIQKAVIDVMSKPTEILDTAQSIAGKPLAYYTKLSPRALAKVLDQLEEKMYRHADHLEFEEAAALRDQLNMLEQATDLKPS